MKLHLKKRIGMHRGSVSLTICERWVTACRVFMDKWALLNCDVNLICQHCLRKLEKLCAQ